jgi:hypothetical protein
MPDYQLVRIRNYRCGDYDGCTYVLAPTLWNEDEIQRRVNLAEDAYIDQIKAARELEKTEAPPYVYQPAYAKYPDKTVKEVQAIHEEAKAKRGQLGEETKTDSMPTPAKIVGGSDYDEDDFA